MASNFQLFAHRNNDSLYLQLYGDFDGNSAHQLIDTLIQKGRDVSNVFIDTNDLSRVYSFGINVFEKKARSLKKHSNLVFIGKNKTAFVIEYMY